MIYELRSIYEHVFFYPSLYRFEMCCYMTVMMIEICGSGMRNKWVIQPDLYIFLQICSTDNDPRGDSWSLFAVIVTSIRTHWLLRWSHLCIPKYI